MKKNNQSFSTVSVLAHPYLLGRDDLIDSFVKDGIRGIEAYHTEHSPGPVKHYENIALCHGLVVTGGSDCHGMSKGAMLLGRVKVPYSVVEELKKEADKIRGENGGFHP